MSERKESRIWTWAKAKVHKIKENIVPILFCVTGGVIIGGSATALHDSRRITKLENRMNDHVDNNNDNVDKINDAFEYIKKHMDETDSMLDDLSRQNNLLLEKALQRTEGRDAE